MIDLQSYDYIILAYSGGKDSTACYLHLLEEGVPAESIELWHHDVDGQEGSTLMDWPCTRDYCRVFAESMGSPLYFSWKKGGFEREMLRDNAPTAPTCFELPDGRIEWVGGNGPANTRLKFPQVSANLSVRWCSAYLKIDVCASAIRNQYRFVNSRTLVVTGERAEESKARANYKEFEPDRADNRNGKRSVRHVDHWRPVHSWDEQKVWDIIKRHRIRVHPCYYLGWGRCSCAACIFGSAHQFASVHAINPNQIAKLVAYEEQFGHTLKRKKSIPELVVEGTPYAMRQEDIDDALSEEMRKPILVPRSERWRLPAGAFGESCGPT